MTAPRPYRDLSDANLEAMLKDCRISGAQWLNAVTGAYDREIRKISDELAARDLDRAANQQREA